MNPSLRILALGLAVARGDHRLAPKKNLDAEKPEKMNTSRCA